MNLALGNGVPNMQHDPMDIESQIAELLLGMPGTSNEEKWSIIKRRFPDASSEQIVAGAEIAADILEAAAKEYEAHADAITEDLKRRGGGDGGGN